MDEQEFFRNTTDSDKEKIEKLKQTWRVYFPDGTPLEVTAHVAFIIDDRVVFRIGRDPSFIVAEFNLRNIIGYVHVKGEYIWGN